jgi:hypothetical protein
MDLEGEEIGMDSSAVPAEDKTQTDAFAVTMDA